MTAALEDGKVLFLVPHIRSQGEVKGTGDDLTLVLEMKNQVRQGRGLQSSEPRHRQVGGRHAHHPHGRDGPLVVLKGHQLQAVDGEEHQLRPGHQQDHLRAVALHDVRRHHGLWQEETCDLFSFLK